MLKKIFLKKLGKTLISATISPVIFAGSSIALVFVLGMDLASAKKTNKETVKNRNDINENVRLIDKLKVHQILDSNNKKDHDLAMCAIINDDINKCKKQFNNYA